MQGIPHASPWRKFGVRLTALIVVAIVGGWAMSVVLASRPTTTADARAPGGASAIAPIDLMILRGRNLPATEYVEPF